MIQGVAVISLAATRLDLTVDQPISVGHDYEFTPNGGWLLFRGNIPGDGPAELYRLPAAGGVPARMSADLPAGRAIATWRLSSSGSHVVYLADQDLPNVNEVFAAPMPSGGFYKLNEPLIDGGSTQGEFVGAASDRVAYVAGKVHGPFSGIVHELFSVPATGGAPIRLSGSMVAGGDVDRIIAQSDGDRVLYLADQEVDGKLELYSVAMSGGTAIKLNPAINDLSDVLPDGIAFSPDGSRVIFQVDRRPEKRVELYSVPAIGGAAVPLHPALPAGSNISLGSQQFSPDGSRVLYHADQNADEVFELFSVPAAGGASVRLNESLVTSGDVRATGFQFSPDSARVLYLADQFVDEKVELFSVPIGGGSPVNLSGEMVAGGDVEPGAQFSPDSSHVLFRADRLTDDVTELFITPSTGGSIVQLSAPLVTSGNVIQAAFTPDGSQVVYLADQEVDEMFELYAVATGGGEVRKLSGPLIEGGDVLDWEFSPDGSQLVYRADQDVDQLFQLYSVELAVGSAPLSGDFNGDGAVDAADYTKWRDGFGSRYTLADYTNWKTNFGRRSASGLGSSTGFLVPEPPMLTLGASVFVLIIGIRGFRTKPRRLT